jgi:hypothetical protein
MGCSVSCGGRTKSHGIRVSRRQVLTEGVSAGILALRLKFSPGDMLEILVDQFQPNSDVCQFWNNGTDADWADERDLADRGEFLDDIADTVGRLRCCVPEAVRDIAATLPVRGIDYGEDR